MSRFRTAALTVAALAAATTLTACSALHPGVAIEVGEEQITQSRIDEVTRDFCSVIQQASTEKTAYSYADLKRSVVSALTMRLSARMVAEEEGVPTEGASFVEARKGYELNLATYPEDLRGSAIEILTTKEYVTDILVAIGKKEFAAEGRYGQGENALAVRGQDVLGAWMIEKGVTIDPRYDLAVDEQGVVAAVNGTSYPVSDFATQAAGEPPSQEYVAGLPPSQRCG